MASCTSGAFFRLKRTISLDFSAWDVAAISRGMDNEMLDALSLFGPSPSAPRATALLARPGLLDLVALLLAMGRLHRQFRPQSIRRAAGGACLSL